MRWLRAETLAPPEGLRHTQGAGAWPLFCFCLTGLTLVWLPMAMLQQIDSLLNFMTGPQVIADTALMVVLLVIASVIISQLAFWVGRALERLGVSRAASRNTAWVAMILPMVVLLTWQSAFMVKVWVEQVGGFRLAAGGFSLRQLLCLTLGVAMLLGWLRWGLERLIHVLTDPLLGLRLPALILAALASTWVLFHPPAIAGLGRESGQRPPAAQGAPDIILLSLDSLAFEDSGLCDNNAPATMPHLRALAERSTCFTRYYSASNLTFPTTTTMETSTLPWTHWVAHGSRIVPRLMQETVAHRLQQAGYTTHSISAAPGASPDRHGTHGGYDSASLATSGSLHMSLLRAAHVFPDSSSLPGLLTGVLNLLSAIDMQRLGTVNPYAPEYVYDAATPILARRDRPLFLWMHTWPPHSPYLPPPSTKYRLLPKGKLEHYRDFNTDKTTYEPRRQRSIDEQRLRYRETIMGADEKIGELLRTLDRQGRLENALVVVTTDHGESFERGLLGHGGDMLHEAILRIPLLIKLPGQKTARRVDTLASQADLAPTLLDLVHARSLPQAEGRSLRPALLGEPMPEVPVFSMAMQRQSRFHPIRSGHYVVIEGTQKLVYHLASDRHELYDLATDPHEQRDLANERPDQAAKLRELVRKRIAVAEAQRQRGFVNEEQQEPIAP